LSLPLVTRFGADPSVDLEVANKRYVDTSGGGATVTTQRVALASDFSTSSTSFVDITGITITLATRAGGKYYSVFVAIVFQTGANSVPAIRFVEGAANKTGLAISADTADLRAFSQVDEGTLDGDTLKMQVKTDNDTVVIRGVTDKISHMDTYEAS